MAEKKEDPGLPATEAEVRQFIFRELAVYRETSGDTDWVVLWQAEGEEKMRWAGPMRKDEAMHIVLLLRRRGKTAEWQRRDDPKALAARSVG